MYFLVLVAFDYLNQPAHGIHRTAAIAVGAVSGYIIAIRRGFFRRLLYTSVGGLGVASICYPKEAEQYWHQTLNETKTYATILYNFAYGGMAVLVNWLLNRWLKSFVCCSYDKRFNAKYILGIVLIELSSTLPLLASTMPINFGKKYFHSKLICCYRKFHNCPQKPNIRQFYRRNAAKSMFLFLFFLWWCNVEILKWNYHVTLELGTSSTVKWYDRMVDHLVVASFITLLVHMFRTDFQRDNSDFVVKFRRKRSSLLYT